MFERPPQLSGTEREQLRVLRDYLVRLAQSLERAQDAAIAAPASTAIARRTETEATAARRETGELRSLVVKTAERIERQVERLDAELHEEYLALSAFGAYRESVTALFEATARGVVESYDFSSALAAIEERLGTTDSALSTLRGEIRRGLITDPATGETALGIAIAEELRFTGVERQENGLKYYELEPGQTLGLYTATGWQFWIGGAKRGWFDSRDGMLHVANLAVESSLRLGGGWLLSAANGFGIRYTGG